MSQLRPYQTETIAALWAALRGGVPAPLACLPTGAGKSRVVARLCLDAVQNWKGRVLVLVHVKELVQQLAESIRAAWPDVFCPIGVLSAGLGEHSVDTVTVAGIQSAFRRACDIGRIDLVVIDEAHLIPPAGDGMYRTLLDELRIINPKLRIVGLTATPYRLGHGLVFGEGRVFSELVYDVSVVRLMDWPSEDGGPFLTTVRGKRGETPDLSRVHHRGCEFLAAELDTIMEDTERVGRAVDEILRHSVDRKAWLVFCCSVKHAHMVECELAGRGVNVATVTGETPGAERDTIIARFKAGELRALVNVNVLTTGFDAPQVDLVVLLRPTESPGLYYQMVGRGFRLSPGKADCLVLDLAGNIERHGAIETLNDRIKNPDGGQPAPVKSCDSCNEINPAGAAKCIACEAPFFKICKKCGGEGVAWNAENCHHCGKPMIDVARHETVAALGDPIKDTVQSPVWYVVDGIEYEAWTKKGAAETDPKTLCVSYFSGYQRVAREWVCVEHPMFSYARTKAVSWLRQRMRNYDVSPVDGMSAAEIATHAPARLKCPRRIATVRDGKFEKVTEYEWDDVDEEAPVPVSTNFGSTNADDEPPF